MAPLLEERRSGSVSHRQASPRTGRQSRALPDTGQLPRSSRDCAREVGRRATTTPDAHAFPASRTKHSSSRKWRAGQRHPDGTESSNIAKHISLSAHGRKPAAKPTSESTAETRTRDPGRRISCALLPHGGIGQRAANQAFSLTKDQHASGPAVTTLSSAQTVSRPKLAMTRSFSVNA